MDDQLLLSLLRTVITQNTVTIQNVMAIEQYLAMSDEVAASVFSDNIKSCREYITNHYIPILENLVKAEEEMNNGR